VVEVGVAIGACFRDAQRFCRNVTPGGGRVARCLSEFRSGLSPACRSVMIFADAGHRRWDDRDERDLLK
jgi:hypothetical protein